MAIQENAELTDRIDGLEKEASTKQRLSIATTAALENQIEALQLDLKEILTTNPVCQTLFSGPTERASYFSF